MIAINVNNPEVEVGAENEASRNIAIFGASGILDVYDKIPVNIVSGEIVVGSGVYDNQGYLLEISEGETVTFPISTLSTGIKRYDLLVSELSRDGEGVETHVLKIVSGEAAISPAKPTLTRGDFKGGADLRQEEVAAILVNGASATVESKAAVISSGSGDGSSGRSIYVQSAQPSSAVAGDLWFW